MVRERKGHLKMIIIAIDPSGNFTEGKGETGVCVFNPEKEQLETHTIAAESYRSRRTFWQDTTITISTLDKHNDAFIVCEDYFIYPDKATAQTLSKMETPRLLGVLELVFPDIYWQRAIDVKKRWTNEILEKKGFIFAGKRKGSFTLHDSDKTLKTHELDAIRHAIHFHEFKIKKGKV